MSAARVASGGETDAALRFRPLVEADAGPYRELMLEAYALAPDAYTSTAEERAAEARAYWVRRIADPAGLSLAFGAFSGPELVGTVALEFSAKPKTRHKALLIGMYVRPAARDLGTGRALLRVALAAAAARPEVLRVTLTVTEGNLAALALYRRAGFTAFGLEEWAIRTPGGYRAKVHMGLTFSHKLAFAGGDAGPDPAAPASSL